MVNRILSLWNFATWILAIIIALAGLLGFWALMGHLPNSVLVVDRAVPWRQLGTYAVAAIPPLVLSYIAYALIEPDVRTKRHFSPVSFVRWLAVALLALGGLAVFPLYLHDIALGFPDWWVPLAKTILLLAASYACHVFIRSQGEKR